MSTSRDIDRLLEAWFNEPPMLAADRAVGAALSEVEHTRQLRGRWSRWMDLMSNDTNRGPAMRPMGIALVLAAVVVAAVLGGTLLFGGKSQVGGPSASPSASTPTATPIPAPTAIGAFQPLAFNEPFTANLPLGWTVLDNQSTLVTFDYRDDPSADPVWSLAIMDLSTTTVRGSTGYDPWPDDLRPWLASIQYFHDIGQPVPATVAGITGTTIDVGVTYPPGSSPSPQPYHIVQYGAGGFWNLFPPAETYRFWTLNRGDGTGLVCWLLSAPNRFGEATTAAQLVLDSLALQ